MTNADQQEENNVVEEVTEETYEPQETADDSGEASEESHSEETSEDTIEVSRAEYEKYKREAFAAKRLREKRTEGSKESGQTAPSLDQELISRTFLAAQAGITDKEVQNEALRLAQKFGMNIAEALDDADVMTRIKNLQKQKQTQQAIAKQTGGSATRTKDISYYLTHFKQHGDFPAGTPSSMIAKVTMALADGN